MPFSEVCNITANLSWVIPKQVQDDLLVYFTINTYVADNDTEIKDRYRLIYLNCLIL
jgi:hypothetical protein